MQTLALGWVLVVDDEVELMRALCERLEEQGYRTAGFTCGEEALAALQEEDFDLLLCDLMMPGMDGISLLRATLELDPHLQGIVMTGQGTVQTAVEAMKVGAFDYVLKPFKVAELLPVLSRAMEVRRLRLENMELRQTVAMYDLTGMVAFTLDLNLILDNTAEAALQQCQADEVSIMLPADAGGEFYVAVVRGAQRTHILGQRVSMDQGIAGWVARHREPLILHGAVDDPRFAPVRSRTDICTAISMPMVVGGKLVGVLNVNATHRRRPFTPGEIKALHILTSIAAAALESAQLYAQVRVSQEYTRSIIASSLDMIIAVDLDRRIIEFNSAAQETFGYHREEILGGHIDLLYADPEEGLKVHHTTLINGKCVQEIRNRRKNGEVFPSFLAASTLRDAQDVVVGFMGISRDISAQKRQELEAKVLVGVRAEVWRMRNADDIGSVLLRIQEALAALEIQSQDCAVNVVQVGQSPKVRSYNITREQRWQEWGGGEEHEAAVRFVTEFWRAEKCVYRPDLEREDPYQERDKLAAFYGSLRRSVLDVPFSHGTLALNSDRADAFSTQDLAFLEKLAGVLSEGFRRLDDLEALAITERQLHQSQKMEAIGQLAGGVAHDFNNLLTIVRGYGQLLGKRLGENDPHQAFVAEVVKAADRGAGLVRQLLAFSRRQVMQLEVLDLNTVVAELEKMLRPLIGEDIELTAHLAPDLGQIKADRGQLEQVLMNLVVNARDAMPRGGKLIIETANADLDETYTQQHAVVKPGAYVTLSVSDTGVGMDAATQEQIFEPFFTTKALGKGTGLGLATVYGIVKQSDGYVWVYSEPGTGTTFKIYLPRAAQEEQPAAGRVAFQAGRRGSETVLLVEDEEALRKLAALLLREEGYAVLEAGHGEEALQVHRQHQGPVHLLVSDVVMPGMGGQELLEKLRPALPGLKVLFLSGYAVQIVEHQGVLHSGALFLQKPFEADALLFKVREALDTMPPAPVRAVIDQPLTGDSP